MHSLVNLFLFVSLLGLARCGGSKSATVQKKPGIDFITSNSMESVLAQAETSGKLVFVDIMAEWCLPCKMMDKDVFSDPDIGDFMNENFINYKIDAEKENGPVVAMVYQVQAYPTLLFVNSRGDIINKKVGAIYHSELMEMARSALASVAVP
ncbi:MAG: DUF255 domain-containing protein [Saprospiraceae bacterium]|nr:DUF255 domain-containing protein [Saprospiraceae bacterium]